MPATKIVFETQLCCDYLQLCGVLLSEDQCGALFTDQKLKLDRSLIVVHGWIFCFVFLSQRNSDDLRRPVRS